MQKEMAPKEQRNGIKKNGFKHRPYMENFQNLLEPGHEPNMIKTYNPKFAQNFEKYLTPDELKTYVFNSPKMQLLLESEASNSGQNRDEVDQKVKEILNEIGLSRNLLMIRLAGWTITTVGRRILKGIYVNEMNIKKVRDQIGNIPVLYLPSHRSYCDFLLMSYVCFKYDIEIPGIAAGMNLFAMIGMGTFLRNNGAFYMRRSFTGDELYWEIFREYMHALMTVYHIGIEFFIEGTRSRNFKALVPKIGLLSMALEPFFLGQVPDVMIVPVSVSYEKVLEEETFIYEMLGVPKAQETTTGFFKAFKIVVEKFGSMYFDFGEPIMASEFFGNKVKSMPLLNGVPYMEKLDKKQLSLVKELGYEIVHRQQERIVIFTFNLVALFYAYNVFICKQINLEEVCEGVLILKIIFERFGAHVVPEEHNIRNEVMDAIEVHSNVLRFSSTTFKLEIVRPELQAKIDDLRHLKGHNLNPETMQIGMSSFGLQISINPCIFWLSGPAMMILAAMKTAKESDDNSIEQDRLQLHIGELNTLFSHEFVIVPEKQETGFHKNLEILSQLDIFKETTTDKTRFHRNQISDIILSSIVPFLCCYFQVVETILEKFPKDEFTDKEFMASVQERVEILLSSQSNFIHPYCLALDNINIALASLVENAFVEKRKNLIPIRYMCQSTELSKLRNDLRQYLELLPFEINEQCCVMAKL